jgi:acetyl esterase/lipase
VLEALYVIGLNVKKNEGSISFGKSIVCAVWAAPDGHYSVRNILLKGKAMRAHKFILLTILLSIAIGQTGQAEATNRITSQLDVPYLNDGDPKHRLDIYYPKSSNKPLTVLVHIHGGGWRRGDKKMMKATGEFYASQGILFITPNYRLSPEVMHPSHVEDCAAALAWVFAHVNEMGGDRKRIFLSGHSAGAHLAALIGTNHKYMLKYGIKPSHLAGVIPVDTASFNLLSNDNERIVERMIKKAFGDKKLTLIDASPFHNVKKRAVYPEFLIINTTNRAAAARGAKAFSDKLIAAGHEARFVPVTNHTHREMAEGIYDASDPVGKAMLRFIFNGPN